MRNTNRRLIWINNGLSEPLTNTEIKPYVRLLEFHGYDVSLSESGVEGISLLKNSNFDAVIVNNCKLSNQKENIFAWIRTEDPHIPIILLSKTYGDEVREEVSLYNVGDVLIMPTNPRQLVSSIELLLDKELMREKYSPQAYVKNFNRQYAIQDNSISDSETVSDQNEWEAWIDTYLKYVEWDIRLDSLSNVDELKTIHAAEKREANSAFADYIQKNYSSWFESQDSPTLSVDVFHKFVIPEIQIGKSVMLVVIDGMRLDHWCKIEPLLYPDFHLTKHYYYSILPTTTRFARNAIFSGLFPMELAERYPHLYAEPEEGSTSVNRYEKELLRLQLDRYGITLKPLPHYFKIFDEQGEIQYLDWLKDANQISFTSVVVDFIDMLTHQRNEISLFQQLIPNEEAFRRVVETWFQNSRLNKMFKFAAERGLTIIVTSDHGSVLCQNGVKVSSPNELSSGLRAKEGRDISCPLEAGFLIDNPEAYRLPNNDLETNYILAREDYYFVYDKQFRVYSDIFAGSFQHGGISFEEMLLPCTVLEPR